MSTADITEATAEATTAAVIMGTEATAGTEEVVNMADMVAAMGAADMAAGETLAAATPAPVTATAGAIVALDPVTGTGMRETQAMAVVITTDLDPDRATGVRTTVMALMAVVALAAALVLATVLGTAPALDTVPRATRPSPIILIEGAFAPPPLSRRNPSDAVL